MNLKRLGIVVAVLIYLPVSTFLAHLIPGTDWLTAVIVGPVMGFCAGTILSMGLYGLAALWRWLREKPETAGRCAHLGAAGLRCVDRFGHRGKHSTDSVDREANPVMSLERWHRLYDKGIDPDTHRCNMWEPCTDCREVERELAE